MLKTWLARQAYTLLLGLLTPAYLWRVWRRGRDEPLYRLDWPQRLGWYGRAHRDAVDAVQAQAFAAAGPLVWVHAVSLGETLAARPLINALRQTWPGMRLLLTHGTATGREAGRALLLESDVQTWLPYDTPGAVHRFLQLHRPVLGVLMETEIWPNLQRGAEAFRLPMVLANARLSEKSLRQALRFAPLLRPAAQSLLMALAQTESDAQRLTQAGVTKVEVCGNVKFDLNPSPDLLARGRAWAVASARPIVLAAVTREGEEAELLDIWRRLANTRVDAMAGSAKPRLMIVPRHPQRFDEVATLATQRGMTVSRRSTWGADGPDELALDCEVWLGDSMGEMAAYYAAAQVALLGGSFAPLGGQNLIEAAACGCPLVMGPHTFNFADAAELSLAAGAAIRVSTLVEGVAEARTLLAPDIRSAMSSRALHFAGNHRGAAQRMAQIIAKTQDFPRF